MIIVMYEGTDGVGKSTAAMRTAEMLEAPLVHFGPPLEGVDPFDEYVDAVLENDRRVVLDRSPFGSMVWSSLGLHEPTMTPRRRRELARWYAQNGAWLHVVVRPDSEIEATLRERDGASDDDVELSLEAQWRYLELLDDGEFQYYPVTVTTSQLLHHEGEMQDGI